MIFPSTYVMSTVVLTNRSVPAKEKVNPPYQVFLSVAAQLSRQDINELLVASTCINATLENGWHKLASLRWPALLFNTRAPAASTVTVGEMQRPRTRPRRQTSSAFAAASSARSSRSQNKLREYYLMRLVVLL
jgi:hypothetical protein